VSGHFDGHTAGIRALAFSPDGKRITSGSHDQIRIWDVQGGNLLSEPFENARPFESIAFSLDGKYIVSALGGVWDETGRLVSEHDHRHPSAVSPDGKYIVFRDLGHSILVEDAQTKTLISGPFEHRLRPQSIALSPDGKYIGFGDSDNMVRVRNMHTGKLVSGPYEGHINVILSVSFSQDSKRIVSGSLDNTIRVWNVQPMGLVVGPLEGQLWHPMCHILARRQTDLLWIE
jgi:WD40 repeat protein